MAGGRGKPKKQPKQKIQEPEPESEEEQVNESEMIESNVDLSIGETEDIEQDPESMEDSESEPEEPPKIAKKVIDSKKTDKKAVGRKKKVQKVVDESSSKKKVKKDGKSSIVFSRYIHQVLKQVHPERTISSKAMNIMNNFVCDMFERLANESSNLTKIGKTLTMSSREIQTSVRLLLPGKFLCPQFLKKLFLMDLFIYCQAN